MPRPIILLVDDDPVLLRSLRGQIEQMFGRRYQTELSQGGPQALEILEELREEGADVRLVITDWWMPDMSGGDLLLEINQRFPEVKKVLLSGMNDHPDIPMLTEQAGLSATLEKPWDAKALENLLNNLMEA